MIKQSSSSTSSSSTTSTTSSTTSTSTSMIMIDNSKNVYIPFYLKCGITAQCSLDVFELCPKILDIMEEDVNNCLKVLPLSVHDLVRRTNVWINVHYSYGFLDHPKEVKHSTVHHYERWLICVNDIPEKVLGIEIYNCFEYIQNRNHWNGCGLLLHEFCHLIHQLVLPNGLDNDIVKDMYELAMKGGKYKEVIRRDWAYMPCDKDTAYATINHKEFFTELSVAFLSQGHGYLDAMIHTESNSNSSRRMSMDINIDTDVDTDVIDIDIDIDIDTLSPPFQAPEVIIRQKRCHSSSRKDKGRESKSLFFRKLYSSMREIMSINKGKHCNKFYPFTKKQLELFDHDTFISMMEIWNVVTLWKDPLSPVSCWKSTMNITTSMMYYCICWKPKKGENKRMEERLLSNDFTAHNHFYQRIEEVHLIPDSIDL